MTEAEKQEIVTRVYRLVMYGTEDEDKIKENEHQRLARAKHERLGVVAILGLFALLLLLYVTFGG